MKRTLVAKAIVMDQEQHCLVLRRSQTHPDMAGAPDLPGGWVEPHESLFESVAREIEEEAGLSVEATNEDVYYADTTARNDRSVTRVLFVISVAANKPEITLSDEHDDYTWVPLADLAQTMTHPVWHAGITYIQENGLVA